MIKTVEFKPQCFEKLMKARDRKAYKYVFIITTRYQVM